MGPELQGNLAPAQPLIERARRERAFFNQYSDPTKVPDHVLSVPPVLDSVPEEVGTYFPSLEGKYVCEVGCGYGVISAYFAQRGARVAAFDVSESNLLIARRTACINGVADRITLQLMQGECLAYRSNTFDLVFGSAVLHHLDIAHSAREFYRVLKPGGVAIFREPLGENRLLEWARRCPLRSSGHRHTADERSLRYQDVEILRSVFPQLAFREVELLMACRAIFRRVKVGIIAVTPYGKVTRALGRLDDWLFSHWASIRHFASYSVVSMVKPTAGNSCGPEMIES